MYTFSYLHVTSLFITFSYNEQDGKTAKLSALSTLNFTLCLHRDPDQVVETSTQYYTFLHRVAQRVSRCLGWLLISVRSNTM
jgi:hypothetical protein